MSFDLDSPPAWTRVMEPLYRIGTRAFHEAYDRGWRRARTLPRPVISVGNLVAGGTGKTPTVLALAKAALAAGQRPAVLTRGYRGRGPGGILVRGERVGGKTTARNDRELSREVGDEAVLLSRGLPEVPIGVGKNRWKRGRSVLDAFPDTDCFLLDDGFQHRKLDRQVDLVLVDATHPFANGSYLPSGPLREGPQALRRASAVLVTRGAHEERIPGATDRWLDKYAPRCPRFTAFAELGGICSLEGDPQTMEKLKGGGGKFLAVAAIARPHRLRRTLETYGLNVLKTAWYRDHHLFTAAQVSRLESQAVEENLRLVTTTKDAVRLRGLANPDANWLVADVALQAEDGWEHVWNQLRGRAVSRFEWDRQPDN